MASTYSDILGINLIGTGDQSGAWGNTTNFNLGTLLEQAITGLVYQPFTSTDITLPISAGADAGGNTTPGVIYGSPASPASVAVPVSARNYYIICTGTTLTAGNHLYLPALSPASTAFTKTMYVRNATAGGPIIVAVSGSGGASVSVPSGTAVAIGSDGTNVVPLSTYTPSLTTPSLNMTGPVNFYAAQPGIGVAQTATIPSGAGETVTSAAQVNSPNLALTIATPGVYEFIVTVAFVTSTLGIDCGINYSAAFTGGYFSLTGYVGSNTNVAFTNTQVSTVGTSPAFGAVYGSAPGTNTSAQLLNFVGTITVTTGGGVFAFNRGVYTTGTGALTILGGSYMKITRLS